MQRCLKKERSRTRLAPPQPNFFCNFDNVLSSRFFFLRPLSTKREISSSFLIVYKSSLSLSLSVPPHPNAKISSPPPRSARSASLSGGPTRRRRAPGRARTGCGLGPVVEVFCGCFFLFFFFPSVRRFSVSLSLPLSLSPSLSLCIRGKQPGTKQVPPPHHADPGAGVHPRPALPHDDRARPRRRAAAELDPKHLGQLVAPVAGRAALLLRGAVGCVFSFVGLFVCENGCALEVRVVEREGEGEAVRAGGGRRRKKRRQRGRSSRFFS